MSKGLTLILKPATAACVAAGIVASAAVLAQSSETMMRSSFERALASAAAPPSQIRTTPQASAQAPVAGSEAFWLSAMGRDAGSVKGVSLGDRITLTLDGKERSFRVTSVSDIAPPATSIDTRPRLERMVLVTAKDTADALSNPIRFVIELTDPATGAVAQKSQRAS